MCVLIEISLKFIPKSPIDIKSALIQVMAWCQTGNKPSSLPMVTMFVWHYKVSPGLNELIYFDIMAWFKDWYLRVTFCEGWENVCSGHNKQNSMA